MKSIKKNMLAAFICVFVVWVVGISLSLIYVPDNFTLSLVINSLGIFVILFIVYKWYTINAISSLRTNSVEETISDLLVNSETPMVVTDKNFDILNVNSGFESLFGLKSMNELTEDNLFQAINLVPINDNGFSFILNEDSDNVHWMDFGVIKLASSEKIDVELEVTFSKKSNNYIIFIRNVSDFKVIERRLNNEIFNDKLTQLPNRQSFMKDFNSVINEFKISKTDPCHSHLSIINLDKFNSVNSTEGLNAGNLVLKDFSKMLKGYLNSENVGIYYLGGDEYLLHYKNWEVRDVEKNIDELMDLFKHNRQLNDTGYHLSASLGIVQYPNDGKSIESLLKHCNVALEHAKKTIGNSYCFFNQKMSEMISERNELLAEMKYCLEKNKNFHLLYQPKVDIQNDGMYGVEALLRWKYKNHPMSPAVFIPIAEESGLATPIFKFVFNKAIEDLHSIIGDQLKSLSINVSAKQLSTPDDINDLLVILEKNQSYSKYIILEITETCIMENYDMAIDCLNKIRDMGYSISIDDFGTGYSSLSTLRHLPVQELKIDRSFIKNIPNEVDEAIVKTIINMAKSFKFKVVAEGVEEKPQVQFLSEAGCDIIQGFYFSKPLDIERLKKFSIDTF
jgi:diguanylate cyclase (GGDEF)-like protein